MSTRGENYGVAIVSERARHRWSTTEHRDTLTETQAELHRYLYEETRANGYQPSYRETLERFGWSSHNAVVNHLKALAKKGWITTSTGESRAIRFLRKPDGTPFEGFKD